MYVILLGKPVQAMRFRFSVYEKISFFLLFQAHQTRSLGSTEEEDGGQGKGKELKWC